MTPKLVELEDAVHYTLPVARELVAVLPPVGERAARIRLHLDGAITLDIPVSRKTLAVLAHDLRKYLPKVGGDS